MFLPLWKRQFKLLGSTAESKRIHQHLQYFTRSLSDAQDDRRDLRDLLQETYGIDPTSHNGIFKAMESVYGKDLKAEHFNTFGKEGINALAASVEQETKKRQGRKETPCTMLRVSIPHHGTSFDLKWRVGESVLDVAKNNQELLGEYMEGTCGGNMSCCTCHIYVEQPELRKYLAEPDEGELDMLVRTLEFLPSGYCHQKNSHSLNFAGSCIRAYRCIETRVSSQAHKRNAFQLITARD